MPSISKAQAAALADLGNVGSNRSDFGAVRLSVTENVLAQYGAEFKMKVVELLNQKKNIGQGALADSITPEIVNSATETILRIKLLDYYDFINQGVKGVKSSANAPNSPYKFKNYGMSAEGRASLRQYIMSGKAKVASVKKDVAYGTGLESKGKRLSEEDTQLNTLIYMIKRFGIKGTKYFTEAFEQTFGDFETVMSEAVGADIILNLKQIGKK
jgi:hypothetical protein